MERGEDGVEGSRPNNARWVGVNGISVIWSCFEMYGMAGRRRRTTWENRAAREVQRSHHVRSGERKKSNLYNNVSLEIKEL